jgi:hypothetical protein
MSGRSKDIACAYNAVAVTPNNDTVIPTTRALYVGVAGNIVVRMADGAQVTFANVPVGIIPIQVDRVLATSTTATNIVALY